MNRSRLHLSACLLWAILWCALRAPSGLAQPASEKPRLGLGEFEPNLPLILLQLKQPITSEQKVPSTFRLICPKGPACGPTNVLACGAKYHGAVSRGLPKKSFTISLDAAEQLLDMRKDDDWLLNASFIDPSLMRHKLSFDLFRSLANGPARRFAAGSRFVELYLNGRYEGVYLLMERVDRRLMELRSYNSNDITHAGIYKAVDHAANFGAPGHGGYEQREPNPALKAFWKPLDAFNRFVSGSSPEQLWKPETGVESRLDLDNAIDFHLLVLLTSNSDGITKNFFFARNAPEPGGPEPRFFFAPWDYDGSFGQNWNGSTYPPTVWLSNHLFERLLRHQAYREKFIARWKYLREHQFSADAINAGIDENVRTLGPAVSRNAARWGFARRSPGRMNFEQEIVYMKSWTRARIKWLDREIGTNLPRRFK